MQEQVPPDARKQGRTDQITCADIVQGIISRPKEMFFLLPNLENVAKEKDDVRLSDSLASNRATATVCTRKEDPKHLYDYRCAGYAETLQVAVPPSVAWLEPLKKFVGKLKEVLTTAAGG